MNIIIVLELDDPSELDAEEVKRDIQGTEDQIGREYRYRVKVLEVI